MKIIAILRNQRMFNILKGYADLNNFDIVHYINVEDFLNNYSLYINDDVYMVVNAGIEIGHNVLSLKNIKAIQQFGIGVENVDLEEAANNKIPVFNVPTKGTANATSVAELSMFYALALARDYNGCINSINHGIANEPMGISLAGKKFGIIGMGGIGLELIRLLKPFNTVIYGIKHTKPEKDYAKKLGIEFTGTFADDFKIILPKLDFIVLALPLNETTQNILNGETINLLKNGSYVINVGRAGLIEKYALIQALKSGKIKGAGLDVLWEEPAHIRDEIFHFNVIATPHIGGATESSINDIAGIGMENIKNYIDNKSLKNCVNSEALS
ncbi:MAG: NAD(P)-binding domain-containing protein [Deltaproteobacteria bacterium]|nr:NAD(P)-binding domain-containing protein [Deltaproteobacteria bacterium]